MRLCLYRPGLLLILVLLMLSTSTLAQDNELTVVGSGIVEPVFRALVEASEIDLDVNISVTGTNTGFDTFCAGEADITTATRAMSTDEAALCAETEISSVELVIGQKILAFITHPEVNFAACLTAEELNTLYAPSAEGTITNWNQVSEEAPDLPLTIYAPDEFTPEFAILDSVIEGDSIRADATVTDDPVQAVSETSGAVGLVNLHEARAAGSSVNILELDASDIPGCQSPSAEVAEDDLYPAAEKLYVYAAADAVQTQAVNDLLAFMVSEEAAAVIEEAGFFAPTDILAQTNQDRLQAAITGEVETGSQMGYTIPFGVSGTSNIGGAGEGYTLLQSAITDFSTIVPEVTVNLELEGLPAGFRALCNGEVDFIYSYREPNEEEIANCEANEISLLTVNIGTQAVVLLANAESNYLSCLTTDQIVTLWQAQTGEAITNWNQVGDTFPDAEMTLFSPQPGHQDTDLLLLTTSGSSVPGRVDVELNNDPLYRAAATANVVGALTFMSWADYQRVLANNQQNIQLVAVDAGNGCVEAATSTIRDGSYPLVRQGLLIINENQLAIPAVQAFIWNMFEADNLIAFEDSGFIGLRLTDLESVRATLVEAFNEASIRMIQQSEAEATEEPEATAEATAEATEETE